VTIIARPHHVQVVYLDHSGLGGQRVADLAGSSPAGAASMNTRPDAFSRPWAACSMSPAISSEAIASARSKPAASITPAAIAVAMKPYRSVRMCW
jgi:hypothetical protein